jgi:hypothetical protein
LPAVATMVIADVLLSGVRRRAPARGGFTFAFLKGLPKWAEIPVARAAALAVLAVAVESESADRIPPIREDLLVGKGGHPVLQSGTQPWASRQRSRQKMSSFTMGECPVDNRPREPFRISSILASVVSCNGDANKTNISRPIRERPNHRAETDLRPAPSRI